MIEFENSINNEINKISLYSTMSKMKNKEKHLKYDDFKIIKQSSSDLIK